MTITKADLVETISRQMSPSITKRDVGKIVQMFIDEVCKTLQEGNRIEIRGFGSFSVKTWRARTARNPRTGAFVEVRQKRFPVFRKSTRAS